MNVRYLITSESSLCNSSIAVYFSMVPAEDDDRILTMGVSSRNSRPRPASRSQAFSVLFMICRMAVRWYNYFLRRVAFQNQNQNGSDLASNNNPFINNSLIWMVMECITLTIQIIITAYTLLVSKGETPAAIWPIRIWVSGYAFACFLSLMLLCCRYFLLFHHRPRDNNNNNNNNNVFSAPPPSHAQHQTTIDEESRLRAMEKLRSSVELFFAIWFVMGNVLALDYYSRFGSLFHYRAPKLHVLCIILLSWNALTYSIPFILFLLLCCCVPLFSSILGYNNNIMGSIHPRRRLGASDDRLSTLPSWKYKEEEEEEVIGNNIECCICLASYCENEEIRQLPCSHIFHLKCVDQWLRILSSCPLCKKELAS